ncbi:hypothetical protein GGH92_008017, partial [Coemansia sp. RSA 2673]
MSIQRPILTHGLVLFTTRKFAQQYAQQLLFFRFHSLTQHSSYLSALTAVGRSRTSATFGIMKQQSISSFFGGGGSNKGNGNGTDKDLLDKSKPKPATKKPADGDVYKAGTVVTKPVKPVLNVTRSFVDADTAQALAT